MTKHNSTRTQFSDRTEGRERRTARREKRAAKRAFAFMAGA